MIKALLNPPSASFLVCFPYFSFRVHSNQTICCWKHKLSYMFRSLEPSKKKVDLFTMCHSSVVAGICYAEVVMGDYWYAWRLLSYSWCSYLRWFGSKGTKGFRISWCSEMSALKIVFDKGKICIYFFYDMNDVLILVTSIFAPKKKKLLFFDQLIWSSYLIGVLLVLLFLVKVINLAVSKKVKVGQNFSSISDGDKL